jgi:archaeal flagellar protein FlaJ
MAEDVAPIYFERIALFGLRTSAILGVVGGLLALVDMGLGDIGLAILLLALATGLLAAIASMPVTTLRRLRADVTGGSTYDRLRGQRPLRIASALLSFLLLAGTLLLVILLGVHFGLIGVAVRKSILYTAALILTTILAVTAAIAHSQSLKTPIQRDRSILPVVLSLLSFGVALLAFVGGLLEWAGQTDFLRAWARLDREDVPIALLLGFIALSYGLARSRTLPGLSTLMSQSKVAAGRATGSRRNASVLVPAILAFALMLVVFLLVLLFGIGVGDILVSVGSSPLLLGVMVFLIVALLASLAVGLRLAKSAEKEEALFQELTDAKRRFVYTLLGGSAIVGAIFLALAMLSFTGTLPRILWIHMLCLGLLVILGPYGFYAAKEHRRIQQLEERFPDFLRDIASSHKGGLTLHQAVTIAAGGEYGPLTPEVHKMADQLSWNVSFQEALERFAERVETPLVQRATSLILAADRSGGATTDVLLAAARDAREIKNLETERRLTMSLYTVVVYITFFVFLGVAAILYGSFAPQIVASSQAVESLGAQPVGGLGGQGLRLDQYRLFYFAGAVIQGIGDGILAGMLGTGRAGLGLRHAFLMVLITYVTFAFLLA